MFIARLRLPAARAGERRYFGSRGIQPNEASMSASHGTLVLALRATFGAGTA
jgi:hypothetical protein